MYTHACNLLLARKKTFFQNIYLIVHLSENFSLTPITNILSKRNNMTENYNKLIFFISLFLERKALEYRKVLHLSWDKK